MLRWPPQLRGARAAFVFLTRIPVGGFPYTDEDWRWAAAYFPLVGAVVGALTGASMIALLPIGELGAAICALAISMLLTGAFHEDGLADSADALFGSFDREKLFAILKDSRIGTFGAAALIVSVGLRAVLLARLSEDALGACVLAGALARTPPVWMMATLPYVTADAQSRSRNLTRARRPQAIAASLIALGVIALGIAWGALSISGALAIAAALAGIAVISSWRFVVRAGGITGDFLGATEQLGECAVLMILATGPVAASAS